MTRVESSKDTAGVTGVDTAEGPPDGEDPRVRAHSDLTVHGRQDHGDKANPHSGAAGRATAADHPASVRNVVLVGHSGSGKTTLVEALALTAGAVNRAGRVEDGGTVSDYDEIEHRQQRSVQLSLVPVEWGGYKINLLDTPGYADFVGELRAGLRAADAALFVVSASDGVDGSTRMVWEECAAVGMPRAIVVTHLEAARADFEEMTRTCAQTFGGDDPDAVLPLYLPLRGPQGPDGHAPVTGLTGLLSQKLFDYSSGERKESEPGPEQLPAIEEARNRLIEGIIAESEDETLMDRYLGGEEIDVTTLVDDLERAVARGVFHPVLAAAPAADGAKQGLGTVEILELVTGGFPTPLERETPAVTTPEGTPREIKATCDPDGPLVAEVVKTASDPYVGRISLVRVFSGTLRPDATVHVSGHGLADRGHEDHDVDERIGALSTPFGKQQRTLTHCIAGDLACVAKLSRAETGDTLSAKDDPLLMEPWEMPDPCSPSPSRRTARPTRTSSPRGWPGWSPRTRPCGSNRTRTPTRSSCGAWARRTRTWPWNGCAAGTASRSTSFRTGSPCARRSPTGRPGAAGM